MGNGKALKPRQLNAIKLLATGAPAYQVAERLEVSTMTISRWRRLPEFEAQLRSIASSGLEEIAKKMNSTTLTAIETLQEVMCDMTEPVGTRAKVALGVLHAMASVNNALEKSLQHRTADFDPKQRWIDPPFTYDSSGKPYVTRSG